jgi:site-specific DNA recombinase
MTTAIIYARVSTVGQAEDELPVESQLDTCRRKAKDIGATVLREFVDAGISGRTDDRPAFLDALAFCKVNKIDHFICWNTSRFSRDHLHAALYKQRLEKLGTKMSYASLSLDSATKEGWMMEGVLELMDEFYSRQVSDDTTRSMMKNARDGFFNGGNTPFGYTPISDGKRRRLVIVEHEAPIVRKIFALASDGYGAKSIALELNRIGSMRRGAPWSKNTVGNLLRNWAMCGYVVFNRHAHHATAAKPECDWVKVRSYSAIIDEEQFMKVQNIITGRAPVAGRGSSQSNFLFTGMLKCGTCASTLQIVSGTGRGGKQYHYYDCGAHVRGTGCASRTFRADAFDDWMADYIVTRLMSVDNLRVIAGDIDQAAGKWARERSERRTELVAELRGIEGRRNRLYNLLETKDPADLNLGDLKPRLMALNARALGIERSLTALELEEQPSTVNDIDLMALQAFVRDVVLSSNNPMKIREFFAGFVSEIIITDGDARINYRQDRLVTANATETIQAVQGKTKWLPERVLPRTGSSVVRLPDRFRRAA